MAMFRFDTLIKLCPHDGSFVICLKTCISPRMGVEDESAMEHHIVLFAYSFYGMSLHDPALSDYDEVLTSISFSKATRNLCVI